MILVFWHVLQAFFHFPNFKNRSDPLSLPGFLSSRDTELYFEAVQALDLENFQNATASCKRHSSPREMPILLIREHAYYTHRCGRLLVFARVRTIVFARGSTYSFLHAGVSYEHNLMYIFILVFCHVCVCS